MRGVVLILGVLSASAWAFDPTVTFTGGVVKKWNANGMSVDVYAEARIQTEKGEVGVSYTGSGIREQKILFLKEPIYVAAHYLASKTPMDPADPLHSIRNSGWDLLQLTLVRDLRAAQIRSAFEDALEINGIDLTEETTAKLLAEIKYDMQAGARLSFVADGDDTLHVLAPWDSFSAVRADVAYEMWLPFFGKSIDAEMKKLKLQLMGGSK